MNSGVPRESGRNTSTCQVGGTPQLHSRRAAGLGILPGLPPYVSLHFSYVWTLDRILYKDLANVSVSEVCEPFQHAPERGVGL